MLSKYLSEYLSEMKTDKVKKLNLILMLILFTSGYTQTKTGNVVGTTNLSALDVAHIKIVETGEQLKSSAYNKGLLNIGDVVSLVFIEKNTYEVKNDNLLNAGITVYAYSNDENTSQYYQPLSLQPYLFKEILFFENNDHLKTSIKELNDLFESTTFEDKDELFLDKFEQEFVGFTSFRTSFNTKYDFEKGVTDSEMRKAYKEDFLNDPVLKTLVNKNRLIGVGDSIIYLHNEQDYIKFKNTNDEILSEVITFNGNENLVVWDGIKKYGKKINVVTPLINRFNDERLPTRDTVEIVENNITSRFITIPYGNNINCSANKKTLSIDLIKETKVIQNGIETWERNIHFDPTDDVNAKLTIDWGDGNIQVFHGYPINYLVEHTYSASGTYYPKTKLEYTFTQDYNDNPNNGNIVYTLRDGNGTEGTPMEIRVNNDICSDANITVGPVYTDQNPGNWRMVNALWHTRRDFLGTLIGSYTHAYVKENGVWKRRSAEVYSYVTGKFLNNDCTGNETKTGAKWKRNARKAKKTKSFVFRRFDIANGDIRSVHWLKKGNVHLQKELSIIPCP